MTGASKRSYHFAIPLPTFCGETSSRNMFMHCVVHAMIRCVFNIYIYMSYILLRKLDVNSYIHKNIHLSRVFLACDRAIRHKAQTRWMPCPLSATCHDLFTRLLGHMAQIRLSHKWRSRKKTWFIFMDSS